MNTPLNLLCIAIDDLGCYLGCLNHGTKAHTPHIDALAERGMLFERAFCPAPICVPGRTAVLSGKAPTTSGCYVNVCGPSDKDQWRRSPALDADSCLPAWFRRHGYRTLSVGKFFHGEPEGIWDEHRPSGCIEPDLQADPRESLQGVDNSDGFSFHWGPLDAAGEAQLYDGQTADWAIAQLQREQPQPFLLAPGFVRPHTPMLAPRWCFEANDPDTINLPQPDSAVFERLPAFARAIALTSGGYETIGAQDRHIEDQGLRRRIVHAYLAATTYVDACIGRVLDALAASPYADSTVVALWVDHGWSLGDRYHWKKWALWQSSTQVPFIIARPGDAARRCPMPVSTIDLMPTVSACCGIPSHPDWEGHSLMPQLEQPRTPRPQPVITTYGPGNHALRSPELSVLCYADGSREIFDPVADPHEQCDLAGDPQWQARADVLMQALPATLARPLHQQDRDPIEALANMRDGDRVPLGCLRGDIADRALQIDSRCRVTGDDGLIVAMKAMSAGFALMIRDRRLYFGLRDAPRPLHPDTFRPQEHLLRAERTLPADWVDIRLRLERDGTARLYMDDTRVAEGRFPGPLSHQPVATIVAGRQDSTVRDYGLPAASSPDADTVFPGELASVQVRWEKSEAGEPGH